MKNYMEDKDDASYISINLILFEINGNITILTFSNFHIYAYSFL